MTNRTLVWIAVVVCVGFIAVAFLLRPPATRTNQTSGAGGAEPSPTPAPSSSTPFSSDGADVDVAASLDEILGSDDPRTRAPRFGRRFREWFDANPDDALNYLRQMPPGSEYTAGLLIALGSIGESNPETAVHLAGELASRKEDFVVFNILFDRIAREHPERLDEFLNQVPAGEARQAATRAAFEELAQTDPESALNVALGIPEIPQRGVAIEATLIVLAERSPEKGIVMARQALSGEALDRVMTLGFKSWAEADPVAAGAQVLTLEPGAVQSTAALNVARALAKGDPQSAIQWLLQIPDSDVQARGLNNVLDLWASSAPEEAKTYVAGLPPGIQDSAAVHLAGLLAAEDPAAAFAWAEKLPNDSLRMELLVTIASAWASNDPESATRWAATFPEDSPARAEAINAALSYWSLTDPSAASALVPALSEAEQPKAATIVAASLAKENPAAALDWADSLANDDIRALAVADIVARWAVEEPQQAAAWLSTRSVPLVDEARSIAEGWAQKDVNAAQAWAQSLPWGPSRDGALDMLASKLAATDRERAVQLATSIGSPPLRAARLEQLSETQR